MRFLELGAKEATAEGFSLTAWSYDLPVDKEEQHRIDVDPINQGFFVTAPGMAWK